LGQEKPLLNLALLQPPKPGKLLPKGRVLNRRPLSNRLPNKALLRGNHLLGLRPRKQNPPHLLLLSWQKFFNEGWCEEIFLMLLISKNRV